VPWCSTCERFLSPPTVTPEGHCPSCGRPVEPGGSHSSGDVPERAPRTEGESAGEEDLGPIPLHIKILGVALVVYLGWRFLQGVEWIIQRL
jgi:hypothetical protein